MAPPAPLTARHLGRATLARQGLLDPMDAPGVLEPDVERSVEVAPRIT